MICWLAFLLLLSVKLLIDLCQGSSIFNFWWKWKRGCEGQMYSVFNGLFDCLTTFRLFSWWNVFLKKTQVDKNSTKQFWKLWVVKMKWSRSFIQCMQKTVKSTPHGLIFICAKFNMSSNLTKVYCWIELVSKLINFIHLLNWNKWTLKWFELINILLYSRIWICLIFE